MFRGSRGDYRIDSHTAIALSAVLLFWKESRLKCQVLCPHCESLEMIKLPSWSQHLMWLSMSLSGPCCGDLTKSWIWFQRMWKGLMTSAVGPFYSSLACTALQPELTKWSVFRNADSLPWLIGCRGPRMQTDPRAWPAALGPSAGRWPSRALRGGCRRGQWEWLWCALWVELQLAPPSGEFLEQRQGSEYPLDSRSAVSPAAAWVLQRAQCSFMS